MNFGGPESSEPICKVTVLDAAGKRYTVTIHAGSLYAAVCTYYALQRAGPYQSYPPLLPETEVEVEAPGGKIHRTTWAKARAWSRRDMERRAAESKLNSSSRARH